MISKFFMLKCDVMSFLSNNFQILPHTVCLPHLVMVCLRAILEVCNI